MSKRGLSARHSVPNQTLSLVNFRLPKGNPIGGNGGRPGGYGGLSSGFHARKGGPGRKSRRRDGRPVAPQAKGRSEASSLHVEVASPRHPPRTARTMTAECEATFSRRIASELCYQIASLQIEGAGKTGCLLHPRSRVRFCANKNGTRAYRAARAFRPSLRNGFTAYFVLFPENGSFASVVDGTFPANLAPAPRRPNHTTSPYASGAYVYRAISVHRISPHVRDDREAPLICARRAELCD